jgi:heterodisulfide reductase subunit A-like polyferredoxin
MDIPDSILSAGAAASQAAKYMKNYQATVSPQAATTS